MMFTGEFVGYGAGVLVACPFCTGPAERSFGQDGVACPCQLAHQTVVDLGGEAGHGADGLDVGQQRSGVSGEVRRTPRQRGIIQFQMGLQRG